MKKVGIFLVFILLLTGCKTTPVDPIVPTVCESNQNLINGVCEDIVIPDKDYDLEMMAMLESFNTDLDTQKIGSSKIDVIVTPMLKSLDGNTSFRTIMITKYDLVNEYYFTSTDSTQTDEFDYIESFGKVEGGYDLYYKNNTDTVHEIIGLDGTFEEEYEDFAKIDFSFELTDDVLSVSSAQVGLYKVTVTKDYLRAHIDDFIGIYLDDLTNNFVVLTIEVKQLDSEYTVSFEIVNDDPDGTYKDITVVLTVKILDEVQRYVIPE